MEVYKRWVRRNNEFVQSLESIANALTWLLPERFSDSEVGPEAVTSILGIFAAVNEHILDTTPSQLHRGPLEPESFPYSLCITLVKNLETLVEVVAQQIYGEDKKWSFIAITEATKALLRLALYRNSGYKMLLQGGETANSEENVDDLIQQLGHGRFSRRAQNGNLKLEGKALSALSRFGEKARMASDPTWFHRVLHQHAILNPPGMEFKSLTLSRFLSEQGLPGGLFMMGEVMFIIRPLVYVLLIRKYGVRSWIPWFISLSMDLVGMGSHHSISWACRKEQPCRFSVAEKDELRRRKLLWAFYLMRDPCFSKYARQRLEMAGKILEPVPVIGFLAEKLIELIIGAQTRYTYISGS